MQIMQIKHLLDKYVPYTCKFYHAAMKCNILYSGKAWRALNLVKLAIFTEFAKLPN